MALHTMAALPSGWIWGHLYSATATEILKYVNQKMAGGEFLAKAGFSSFDSVLKGNHFPQTTGLRRLMNVLGFFWIGP